MIALLFSSALALATPPSGAEGIVPKTSFAIWTSESWSSPTPTSVRLLGTTCALQKSSKCSEPKLSAAWPPYRGWPRGSVS